jgi:NAD(P)-dependent dehydrogenase (short-subunit alcohol dehydrogenase family)
VIVTGGASGIGRSTCLKLAEYGRPVAVWDIQGDKAREVAAECADKYGVRTHAEAVDVCDEGAMAEAVQRTVAALGGVGALAYVAGASIPIPMEELATREWDKQVGINLKGPAVLSRLLLPELRKVGPSAAICIVSSTTAFQGNENIGIYCATKSGVVGLMRSLALYVGRRDRIRVNCVCPGPTDTPMLQSSIEGTPDAAAQRAAMDAHVPLGRVGHPDELATTIRFMLSDDASYVTGQSLIVDGGMSAGF